MDNFLFALIWVLFGFINYGLMLGYSTRKFPEQDHVGICIFVSVFGPLGTIIVLMSARPYHWRIKPLTAEERWDEFHKEYPSLDRNYFEHKYN